MVKQAMFKISGMHCTSCAKLIEMTLEEEKGMEAINVEYESQEACMEFDSGLLTGQEVRDTIESLGYGVIDELYA
jgi:copper chaperone CopZ